MKFCWQFYIALFMHFNCPLILFWAKMPPSWRKLTWKKKCPKICCQNEEKHDNCKSGCKSAPNDKLSVADTILKIQWKLNRFFPDRFIRAILGLFTVYKLWIKREVLSKKIFGWTGKICVFEFEKYFLCTKSYSASFAPGFLTGVQWPKWSFDGSFE